RGRQRVLAARRPVGLVPLPEARVHRRRHAHPPGGAARRPRRPRPGPALRRHRLRARPAGVGPRRAGPARRSAGVAGRVGRRRRGGLRRRRAPPAGGERMRALTATLGAAVAEVRANRASSWAQFVLMVVNDLFWVLFWALFFGRIGTM